MKNKIYLYGIITAGIVTIIATITAIIECKKRKKISADEDEYWDFL